MPPTLSEDEINALVESFTDDNFFEKCLALNPEDPDHVNGIKAAQLAFNSGERTARSFMTVSASNGWLAWRCDGHNGRGSTSGVTGSGHFSGVEFISGSVGPGTFYLTVDNSAISVYLSGGFNWRGTGTQSGLNGVSVSGGYN